MKLLIAPLLIAALFAASCSSTKQMSSAGSDDVYVTKTTPSPEPSTAGSQYDQSNINGSSEEYRTDDAYQSPDYSNSDQYTDANGTTYITNNYYGGNGGWYDNMMYGGPSISLGFGYGYPMYGGFSYYDPFYFSPGFSFSIGFGFGYGYYNPWYSPWYGYPGYAYYAPYYPYYPYYPGYGYGYGCGCGYYDPYGCGGYYAPYYGYYGYRGASASNTGNDNGGRHYKTEGDVLDNGSGRNLVGTPVNADQNSNAIGRSLAVGGVKQNSGGVKSISNSGRNNSDIDKLNLHNNNDGVDRNIQQHNVPSFDRNNTAPDRNNITPRNEGSPRQPRNMAINSVPGSQTFASAGNEKAPVLAQHNSAYSVQHGPMPNVKSSMNNSIQKNSAVRPGSGYNSTVTTHNNSNTVKKNYQSTPSRSYQQPHNGNQVSRSSASTGKSYSGGGGGSRPSYSGGGYSRR